MKDNEEKIRKDLIDYIKANDRQWSKEDLANYSVTALTILKTEIEIRVAHSSKKK